MDGREWACPDVPPCGADWRGCPARRDDDYRMQCEVVKVPDFSLGQALRSRQGGGCRLNSRLMNVQKSFKVVSTARSGPPYSLTSRSVRLHKVIITHTPQPDNSDRERPGRGCVIRIAWMCKVSGSCDFALSKFRPMCSICFLDRSPLGIFALLHLSMRIPNRLL
jgi:hypothetical protein